MKKPRNLAAFIYGIFYTCMGIIKTSQLAQNIVITLSKIILKSGVIIIIVL